MKRMALISLWFLFTIGATHADAYDFEYSYGDPTLAASQTYIESTSNAVTDSEGVYRYWKPNVGGSDFNSTTPGIVNYHFNFADSILDAHLYLTMHTFNWSYSDGYNELYASANGSDWELLMDVTTPDYGNFTGGTYNAILPNSVIGENDIWLQARLYSFGPSASSGNVWTNTAQLSRYDVNRSNTTFSLGVNFDDAGPDPVPEPATILLFGTGLVGLVGSRLRKKKK